MWATIFGPNPWSTVFGYAFFAVLDARVLIETNGEPKTIGAWLTLALGILAAAMGRSK